jgi:hypothetical protein
MSTPRVLQTRAYFPEDIAMDWGLPVSVILGWLDSNALQRNEGGWVTRVELLKFINSEGGQALLRAARS